MWLYIYSSQYYGWPLAIFSELTVQFSTRSVTCLSDYWRSLQPDILSYYSSMKSTIAGCSAHKCCTQHNKFCPVQQVIGLGIPKNCECQTESQLGCGDGDGRVKWWVKHLNCTICTMYRSLSKIRPPPKIRRTLPIFVESYCKGSFIARKYAHPTNQNNMLQHAQ